MAPWTVSVCLFLAVLPFHVLSQGELDLSDALGGDDKSPATSPPKPPKPVAPAEGAGEGGELDLSDFFDVTKAPPKVIPKVPKSTKAPVKPKSGGFSDDDLLDVSKDDTYKPDKGRGGQPGRNDQIGQSDQNSETTAEIGTIAGIVSAVAMALVGAITSYISYQKKKLCFGIQQSLNAEVMKAENPEGVVATEPQVKQTLLEPASAEPPNEENAV
ncbi:CD99 antigen-like protein 2 isoform X3 [Thalassophryne amazonica]|uniref:CD99 antigen-like protein 2 isoform X3 n=1 Tax=Thalassophryne amazonica TaxID=390379 RepID=UPI001470F269|nr:CD99 antigen-like protein 2 isoform X3 [Thalassophryne amazonica]